MQNKGMGGIIEKLWRAWLDNAIRDNWEKMFSLKTYAVQKRREEDEEPPFEDKVGRVSFPSMRVQVATIARDALLGFEPGVPQLDADDQAELGTFRDQLEAEG